MELAGMENAGRHDEQRPLKVVKLHGRQLVERWIPKNAVPFQGPGVDGELPPFIQNPPEAGNPALALCTISVGKQPAIAKNYIVQALAVYAHQGKKVLSPYFMSLFS